jgi:hypothetical protein
MAIASDEVLWMCVSDAMLSGHPMAHVSARHVLAPHSTTKSVFHLSERLPDLVF